MSAVKFAVIKDQTMVLNEYEVQENQNAYDPNGAILGNYANDHNYAA